MTKATLLGALVVIGSSVSARASIFYDTGSIQRFNVPSSGDYKIDSWGAAGGGGFPALQAPGAEVSETFFLTAGQQISVVVGGAGEGGGDTGGSGGGASWVFSVNLLEVAGGGGGVMFNDFSLTTAMSGQGFGGSGLGGHANNGPAAGGGGAGWLSDGEGGGYDPTEHDYSGGGGEGPPSFAGGLTRGNDPYDSNYVYVSFSTGGYGGGGGYGYDDGGGGGGYSGGNGGGYGGEAQGGTSYGSPDGYDAISYAGVSQAGKVTIDAVVPEPRAWLMLLVGMSLVGLQMRSRKTMKVAG